MNTAQLVSLITAVLAVFAATGALIFKTGKWVGGVNEQLATHSSLLRAIFQELRTMRQDMGKMRQDMRTMRQDMGAMRQDVQQLYHRLSEPTIAKNSPRRLSELGEQIAEDLGVAKWARQTAEQMRQRVIGKRPYEIQEICFTYIYNEYQPDPEFDIAIREAAYEHGIDDRSVLAVLVIALRDEFLSRVA